jgi:hypothetical protein
MKKLVMQTSAEKLSAGDIEALEGLVKYRLPEGFKDFYLKSNGGVPERSWVVTDDDYEPLQIVDFKCIAKRTAVDFSDTGYIGGCYSAMLSRNVIPSILLPFGSDDGGNFFCLDLIRGAVVFYAVDIFRPEFSSAANHLAAQRVVAPSFLSLLDGLEWESGLDY